MVLYNRQTLLISAYSGRDTHNILKMKRYLENEENHEDEFRILNQLFVDAGASV